MTAAASAASVLPAGAASTASGLGRTISAPATTPQLQERGGEEREGSEGQCCRRLPALECVVHAGTARSKIRSSPVGKCGALGAALLLAVKGAPAALADGLILGLSTLAGRPKRAGDVAGLGRRAALGKGGARGAARVLGGPLAPAADGGMNAGAAGGGELAEGGAVRSCSERRRPSQPARTPAQQAPPHQLRTHSDMSLVLMQVRVGWKEPVT